MQLAKTSRKTICIAVLSAAAVAVAAYVMLARSPRAKEMDELRAEFAKGNYQQCIDRVVTQPQIFMTDDVKPAQTNLRQLAGNKGFPTVAPRAESLRRRAFYSQVAARLKRADTRETVLAAFNYVVANVASAAGPGEKPGIGATPDVVLLRGYGVCDRGAWVFCTLLEQLRIPAYVIYLRDPETGVSRHTIAGAEIDGSIRLFDTYAGMPVINADGRIATLQDVLRDPASIDRVQIGGKPQLVTGRELANGVVLLPFEPETVHPLAAALHVALGEQAPVIYQDYRKALIHLGAAVFPGVPLEDQFYRLKNPKSGCLLSLWDYPFRIGYNMRIDDYRKEVEAAHQWMRILEDGRRTELGGGRVGMHPAAEADASAGYDMLISSGTAPADAVIAAEFFRASLLARITPDDGLPLARKFLQDHPETYWRDQMLQTLGEALAKAGSYAEAIECLKQVTGPRVLRAAAFIEAARESRLPGETMNDER